MCGKAGGRPLNAARASSEGCTSVWARQAGAGPTNLL